MRALSLAAVGILLLPLGGLAAPADTIASSIMISRDALSPHMSCYGGGEEFENLGSWDQVNATVLAGCHDFASYSGHRFKIGDSVSYHLFAPRLSNPFPSMSLLDCVLTSSSRSTGAVMSSRERAVSSCPCSTKVSQGPGSPRTSATVVGLCSTAGRASSGHSPSVSGEACSRTTGWVLVRALVGSSGMSSLIRTLGLARLGPGGSSYQYIEALRIPTLYPVHRYGHPNKVKLEDPARFKILKTFDTSHFSTLLCL